jgi:hypothetical protein
VQDVDPELDEYVPAGQFVQATPPVEYFPAAQLEHDVAPALDPLPAAQFEQVVAP